jgi:hypothetical protein
MGFFSTQSTQLVRIDDENTVLIRRLTFGESQQVLSESTVFDIIAEDAKLDYAKNQAAKLSRAVVSWEGPGFEGRPVNVENIMALPAEVGRLIVEAVDKLNAGLSESDQKKSPAPTN